ncbi:MAG: DHH family phosphoesterase [Candidatus Omnitrophica bacterium]|jgi:single-stranded-DNA-specific exonuclease|nr:DHH family phosphoesterase [Candidatus Omnitrophota bacterium]
MAFSEYFHEILKDIGIKNTEESIPFLFPEISHLGDPFWLNGVETVCEIIKKTISNKEKVFIYADGDMDGIAGASILGNFFKIIGIDFDVKLTHRLEEYEIDEIFIENILKMGYSLLFIIDSGTNSKQALYYCESHNFTTIVIDHHIFNQKYKFSHVHFINPYVDEDNAYSNMTSAGLTFKLLQALKIYLSFFPEECFFPSLELATLGTLNDYPVLRGENRIIIKIGLKHIVEGTNILGLKLFQQYFYVPQKSDEIETITFFFNPRLNAPGRFGKPEISFNLLISNNQDECEKALKEIENLSDRKQKMLKNVILKKDNIYENDPSFLIFQDIPASFSGIIASQTAAKYQKPSFVGIVSDDIIQGSARGFDEIDLHELFSKEKDIFLSFGGHKNAVGFKLRKKDINKVKKIWESLETREKKVPQKNKIYDMPIEKLDINFIQDLQLLKPFGRQHPEILFRSDSVQITKVVRKEKGKWVAWIKQNNFLFQAHFSNFKHLPNSDISIIYSPQIKKLNSNLFIIWLDIKNYYNATGDLQ